MSGGSADSPPRVLHVLVGHGLPRYFLNGARSIRATAREDHLLIVDNASPNAGLKKALAELAERDDKVDVIFRTVNDVAVNGKVGSLYSAYNAAFEYASVRDYELVHLVQGDMQTLWWDEDVVCKALELYAAHPKCVNILTMLLPRDNLLMEDIVESTTAGIFKVRNYGLVDTGLYDLARWREWEMAFGNAEMEHGKRYLDAAFEVLCHPWPTDAPVPWPPVIRRGVQRGREVTTQEPYLLKPLSADEIMLVKERDRTWLEDVCIPWGWMCLTPMWVTGLESIDYWVLRYRDARRHGLTHFLPRVESRGLEKGKSPMSPGVPFR